MNFVNLFSIRDFLTEFSYNVTKSYTCIFLSNFLVVKTFCFHLQCLKNQCRKQLMSGSKLQPVVRCIWLNFMIFSEWQQLCEFLLYSTFLYELNWLPWCSWKCFFESDVKMPYLKPVYFLLVFAITRRGLVCLSLKISSII